MKHAFRITMAVLLLNITVVMGQDNDSAFSLPEIVRPSPTVAQLMKFEEVDLSHYTGQPNIAIPLFSKSIHGLNYNLALQYQVSGIRVDEQSGWVGKGWALETGGVISRSVVGLPDEINVPGFFMGSNSNDFHEHFNWGIDNYYNPAYYDGFGNLLPTSNGYKAREFYYNVQWALEYKQDYQRDIYQFNFFGHTGRFIFVKEGANLVPKIIGNDTKLKIQVNYTNQTGTYEGFSPHPYPVVIESFTVTDTNGFVYTFDSVEITKNNNYSLVIPQPGSGGSGVAPQLGEDIPSYRSAWKLSKVENAQGKELLNISYKEVTESPKYPKSVKRNLINEQGRNAVVGTGHGGGGYCQSNKVFSSLEPLYVHNYREATITSKKVDTLSFADGVKLIFQSTNDHPEYPGAQLNKILVKTPGGSDNSTFDFVYDTAMRGVNHSLLFLNEVKVNVADPDMYKYTFDYPDKENLKAFGETPKDDFGYYKSDNPELQHTEVTSGALGSITYPTGGLRVFNWESNSYSFRGNCLLSFDEIFQNPDNYSKTADIQDHTTTSEFNNTYPPSAVQTIHIGVAQTLSVGYDFIVNNVNSQQYIEPYNFTVYYTPADSNGNPTGTSKYFRMDGSNSYGSQDVYLEAGHYNFHIAQDPFVEVEAPYNQVTQSVSVTLNIGIKGLNGNSLNWWAYGGGLRLGSVVNKDQGEAQTVTNYNYNLESPETPGNYCNTSDPQNDYLPQPTDYPGNSDPFGPANPQHHYSSGAFDGDANLHRKYTIGIQPIYNLSNVFNYPVYYDVTEFQNELTAQFTQGNFIGYKNVAEYKTLPNAFIINDNDVVKDVPVTKYTFDSPIDHPTFPQNYAYPYPPVKDEDYRRGNLRTQKLMDADNRLLKETKNTYNFDNTNIEQLVSQSLHFSIDENDLLPVEANIGPQQLRKLYDSYYNFINNSVDYDAGDIACLPNIQPGFSNLVLIFGEPFIGGAINPLTVWHVSHMEEFSYKVQMTSSTNKDYYYDGTELEINGVPIPNKFTENRQEYIYAPENYQVKQQDIYYKEKDVDQHYQTKYYYPVAPGGFGLAGVYTLEIQNKINEVIATEQFKNGDRLSTTVNRYKTFDTGDPGSSIDNLVLIEKIQSLKGEGNPPTDGSPWTILVDMEDRIIFEAYDDYGNPTQVRKANGTSISYIWGYDQTLPVAKIVNATRDNIDTVLGTDFHAGSSGLTAANIQALKSSTLLSNAQISTYTHDVIKGITSETDPRGYTMTYEYDEFNRLKFVKDQDGHIVSHNKYHYSTQN